MGLFDFGGSSSSSSTTTNEASINPQLSGGTGVGQYLLNVSPSAVGGSVGAVAVNANNYYAPLSIVDTGEALGDEALQTLANLVTTSTQPQNAATSAIANSGGLNLGSLFSGNNLYLILAAVVLFLLAHHKG